MSAVSTTADNKFSIREGVAELQPFALHFGGKLGALVAAWRIVGPDDAPLVVALGGISAGRNVVSLDAGSPGWWRGVVGREAALDVTRFRILGIDFLGGSGATTGPKHGEASFPSISAYDQAELLARLLSALQIERIHAIVGASYGGMVALAFAERHPNLVDRLVVISAADRPHPMASAWRSVQRATVRALAARGAAAEGLKLARALAMTTYRSPREFKQRFDAEPISTVEGFRLPVEDYLYARGQAYADSYVPESFLCLSESIDLHRVDPAKIRVPTTLVGVIEDQLVPITDMRELNAKLGGTHRIVEISSIYGHDAFLKESSQLREIFAAAL